MGFCLAGWHRRWQSVPLPWRPPSSRGTSLRSLQDQRMLTSATTAALIPAIHECAGLWLGSIASWLAREDVLQQRGIPDEILSRQPSHPHEAGIAAALVLYNFDLGSTVWFADAAVFAAFAFALLIALAIHWESLSFATECQRRQGIRTSGTSPTIRGSPVRSGIKTALRTSRTSGPPHSHIA